MFAIANVAIKGTELLRLLQEFKDNVEVVPPKNRKLMGKDELHLVPDFYLVDVP